MKVATAEEMREIDRIAMESYGIPEVVLMENAGAEAAKAVLALCVGREGVKVSVFAGVGNNGGDAFVAARHLDSHGIKCKVYIIGDAERIQGAAKINLDILQNLNLDILQVASQRDWDKVKIALAFSDILVDGLLGTGFHGVLREEMEQVIQMINEARKKVVAIDLPSGVDANTGSVSCTAVRASQTVSFGLRKIGLLLYPGAKFAGRIEVAGIGLPKILLADEHIKQNMIHTTMVKQLLIERQPDVHKGSCGKVLIVAGSNGMTGAAVLAAQAALRSGAGSVTLAIAESLQDIVAAKLTEVMTQPLPEIHKGVIGMSALPVLLELAEAHHVVEIGSGLGRDPETQKLVCGFIAQTDKQLIVDADAIYALQENRAQLRNAKVMPVLTPHLGEMARLLGQTVQEVQENLVETARSSAQALHAVIVLKSARTIVAYPEGDVYINVRGNAGMATAGSGDVLAGVISGLFAQGLLSYSAATVGVYLHALAGDLAAERGMIGLTAGDIAKMLPVARRQILE